MATFEDQFQEHPVHAALSQLDAAIAQKHDHALDETAVDNLDRLQQGASFIRSRLDVASPVLNTASRLNGVHKGVQNALNEVNQFMSNGNGGHLANASNQLDGPIATAATFPSLPGTSPAISAEDAISFRRLADKAIDRLKARVVEAESRNEELGNRSEELAQTLDSLKSRIDGVETSVDAKLKELEAAFNSAEAERKTAFNQIEDERKKAFETIVKEHSSSAEKTVTALKGKQDEAERIVQLIGNIGLTGNYRGAGTEERKAADRLRMFALLCFFGTFLVIAATLALIAIEGFNPWLALFRTGAALFLLIPETYAAKESTRHRLMENRHRRAELELASIDAYLDDLPGEKRNEIKAESSAKFFEQDPAVDDGVKSDVSGASLVGLLKDAINALSKK